MPEAAILPDLYNYNFAFLGGAPTSMCPFFHPSVRLSIRLLRIISQEHIYHLIIIFGTHMHM